MIKSKYPRTPHLPWSDSVNEERICDVNVFDGQEVVVTEKMDGECTTIYRGGCHARSVDSQAHPSRERIKALAGALSAVLVDGWRVIGENVYARHSISYDALPAYFLAFALQNESGFFSHWDDTVYKLGHELGLSLVPILYRGEWNENKILKCFTGKSKYGGEQEGYVVRLVNEFHVDDFSKSVAKYVRKNHAQTDEHWMQKSIIPNRLSK